MLSLSPEEGNAIKKIQLSLSQRKEKLIWKYDKKGDFSAKSGYWVAKANQTSHSSGRPESSRAPKSDLWRSIWSVKAAPKVKAFFMEALFRCSPFGSQSWKERKLLPNPQCHISSESQETAEHSMLLCDWVDRVWFTSWLGYTVNKEEITYFGEWWIKVTSRELKSKEEKVKSSSSIAYLCWEIWKTRKNSQFYTILIHRERTLKQSKMGSQSEDRPIGCWTSYMKNGRV